MAEDSRWWDKYYVRYFVGTVYAVPLLIALEKTSPAAQAALPKLGQDQWVSAAVVAAAGLAFCYLASAPVLLLHTLRERLTGTARVYRVIGVVIALISLVGIGWVIDEYLRATLISPSVFLALIPFGIVIALELIGLIAFRPAPIKAFYARLAKERKPSDSVVRDDYIESYRHLREHGNALLIILMENVLALALWKAKDPGMMIELIVIWILPPTFVWYIASWLERQMADGELN